MTEPAIDLGICLAIVSSAKDIVIPDNVMVFGEVGLSGEIRAVSMAGQRVQEAKKLGFGTVVLPEVCKSSVGKVEGINLVYVSQIRDAIGYIMKKIDWQTTCLYMVWISRSDCRQRYFCLRKSADREKEERIKSYGEWD